MRRFVDCVRVTDMSLAYTIAEALKKNEKYSVDLVEQSILDARGTSHHSEIELKVYLNEKITVPTIGFCEVEKNDQT